MCIRDRGGTAFPSITEVSTQFLMLYLMIHYASFGLISPSKEYGSGRDFVGGILLCVQTGPSRCQNLNTSRRRINVVANQDVQCSIPFRVYLIHINSLFQQPSDNEGVVFLSSCS
eukprot:TRINITY_DN14414_c0_g1_i1.p2 TRINITY_DN14414_c0_g1~~TRINITY_DN14414_c0_g1_i1.p2  ORF type:complete len:115 (+),score=1.27 TRINITY_DN14414_c0_g1_i1:119-463(+)